MKKSGEMMCFTGGAEASPLVKVGKYHCAGSVNDGKPSLYIAQGEKDVVILSPETMQAILEWYKS